MCCTAAAAVAQWTATRLPRRGLKHVAEYPHARTPPSPLPGADITLFPKALPFTGLPAQQGAAAPNWTFEHTFVASTVGAGLDLDGPATAWDGLNDAGLAVGFLWQSNVGGRPPLAVLLPSRLRPGPRGGEGRV